MNELNINKNSRLFALQINIFNPKENFEIAQKDFKSENPSDLISYANSSNCDILALKFNIQTIEEIPSAVELLKSFLQQIKKPLMICGTSDNEIDKLLLPELTKNLDSKNCIIGNINDKTYKHIIPNIVQGGHYAVLKSPIDINLAKELNILSADMGLPLDKIIMNTDIGGLGYGYEYGFSIMEKVRLEGEKGDKYLDLPLFSDASTESLRTKEAKADDYPPSWGELDSRTKMIEVSACTGAIAAGANIIVVNIPSNIQILKELI